MTARVDEGFCELEDAWWKWVNENCPYSSARARGKWMRQNTFIHKGVVWKREMVADRSNSGKTVVQRVITFHTEDGRIVECDPGFRPNRRNDPDRNWGLGRE